VAKLLFDNLKIYLYFTKVFRFKKITSFSPPFSFHYGVPLHLSVEISDPYILISKHFDFFVKRHHVFPESGCLNELRKFLDKKIVFGKNLILNGLSHKIAVLGNYLPCELAPEPGCAAGHPEEEGADGQP
jgi:hypothetical protein